ncbi:hypothetical protein [Caballeronia sp. J97]|uniref:hypothetical protein n=1 Tax=Caballeronia sp. J97 TaxID=2805429 RepID=UPI002AB14F46|nr:hypothetical protein [Caballeronia sp. J97]
MKNILVALAVILAPNQFANAQTAWHGEPHLNVDLSMLENQCGYKLGEKLLRHVKSSASRIENQIMSVVIYLDVDPFRRAIHAKFSFSCFIASTTGSSPDTAHRTTARAEIQAEDSGGRYTRTIEWQREFRGIDWVGTIAYVNSIYGDGEKRTVPDFFLICPNKDGMTCFALEVEKTTLSKKESDLIPGAIREISIPRKF